MCVQVPQPAALFHNDCQHIARELLTLPYQYAPALTQLAPSAALQCIEAAQRLRAAGAAVLDAQVLCCCYRAEHESGKTLDFNSAKQMNQTAVPP